MKVNKTHCATDIDVTVPDGIEPNKENGTFSDLAVGVSCGVLLAAGGGIVVVVVVFAVMRKVAICDKR